MDQSDGAEALDNVLKELKIGKFHVRIYILIAIMVICLRMSGSSYIFTARDTSYRCRVPACDRNDSIYEQAWLPHAIPYERGLPKKCERFGSGNVTVLDILPINSTMNDINISCDVQTYDNTIFERCDEWVYGDGDSIVRTFNIPCEDWKRSLVGSANSLGYLVSTLYSGTLSDKYGRRNVMVSMIVATGLIGLIQSFSPNYWFFIVFEFLNLAVSAGAFSVVYTMAIEIIPASRRVYSGCVVSASYAIGGVILGLIAMALPSWRSLLIATNVPSFLGIIAFFVIPESIRWLNARGRIKEVSDILEKAAKLNNVTLSTKSAIIMKELSQEKDDIETQLTTKIESQKSPFKSLIKSPKLLVRLLICAFCWFVNLFVFFGLSLNSVSISGDEKNVYLNFILVIAIELPAIVIYLIVVHFLERKYVLFANLILSGLSCIIHSVLPNSHSVYGLVLYLIGKLCIAISFDLVALIASEVFPTCLRNSLLNFCTLVGSVGGILAPQVSLLKSVHHSLPMVTFGILPIVSGLTVLFLPKTTGKKLPDTIQESLDL